MENFQLIKQGAEAKLYQGTYLGKPALIKERFVKKYRQPELDCQITNERLKGESRIIARCKSVGICTPVLYLVDMQRRLIIMEYFENNVTVKEFIYKTNDNESLRKLSSDIGTMLGKMHKHNIIHGDLTTSNMLLINETESDDSYDNLKLVLIDFGLSHVSASFEDKGVDLYVLERALISTHSNAPEIFPVIMESYEKENSKEGKQVLKKFEEVRARGRKRTMVG
ncbi:Threonyl-carbamoyl synthesis 5 [Carabus blaptoides fortunei]